MSDENTDRMKDLEELAREAGVYLSPDRLNALKQRLKDEERRRTIATIEGIEPEYGQRPIDRGATRPVGRPRGSRSSSPIGEKGVVEQPAPEKPQKELYMAGPRLRRFV
jgi:hypothetical protein